MSYNILAVDDEEANIRIIKLYLEDQGQFKLICMSDPVEAFKLLEKKHKDVDLVLLDRMMPHMNGIDFFIKMQENRNLANIPVIMQTVMAERVEVQKAIDVGIYYYLTKPYDRNILLSLIDTAIADAKKGLRLKKDLQQEKILDQQKFINSTNYYKWEIATLKEVEEMAPFIACFFPDPKKVVTGIYEIVVNAIEHGNLAIDFNKKTKLQREGNWLDEINRLQALDKNKNKKVCLEYKRDSKKISLIVTDEGSGFNWKKYLYFAPERISESHGRGIAIANNLCFDQLNYIAPGNKVECVVFLNQ